MYLAPLLIGAFWGAPMIARELEAGTHRLVWNQSVTQINDPVTDMPGAWIVSDQIITRSGSVFVLPDVPACSTGTQAQCDAWLASQPLRQHVVYQPASRYWTFQILETVIWLAIATGLAGLCLWRIRSV
jgi:hypothetical protein